jgi:hypothetical protein
MSRLALHLNGLLVETVRAGWRNELHLIDLPVLQRNNEFTPTDSTKYFNDKSNIKMVDNFVAHVFSQIEIKKKNMAFLLTILNFQASQSQSKDVSSILD